jgi:hypothetical protein
MYTIPSPERQDDPPIPPIKGRTYLLSCVSSSRKFVSSYENLLIGNFPCAVTAASHGEDSYGAGEGCSSPTPDSSVTTSHSQAKCTLLYPNCQGVHYTYHLRFFFPVFTNEDLTLTRFVPPCFLSLTTLECDLRIVIITSYGLEKTEVVGFEPTVPFSTSD